MKNTGSVLEELQLAVAWNFYGSFSRYFHCCYSASASHLINENQSFEYNIIFL